MNKKGMKKMNPNCVTNMLNQQQDSTNNTLNEKVTIGNDNVKDDINNNKTNVT